MENKTVYSLICEAKRLVKNLPLPLIIATVITILVYFLLKNNKNRKKCQILKNYIQF